MFGRATCAIRCRVVTVRGLEVVSRQEGVLRAGVDQASHVVVVPTLAHRTHRMRKDGAQLCDWKGNQNRSVGHPPSNGGTGIGGREMNDAQCQAMKIVLNREKRYGTTAAAWMSAIGFGDGTIQPFNSSNTPPTNTPVGPIKVDWYTNIQGTGPSLTGGGNFLAYTAGKLIWTGLRLATGAPITNYLPFTDSAERNTFAQTLSPFSHYSNIFTPKFMKENCAK